MGAPQRANGQKDNRRFDRHFGIMVSGNQSVCLVLTRLQRRSARSEFDCGRLT